MSNHKLNLLRWSMIGVTISYLVLLVFDIWPLLRGPDEWRWAYALPGSMSRLWLSAILLIGYIGLVAVGFKSRGSSRVRGLLLVLAILATPIIQLSLLYMDHPDVIAPLFYRTVSVESGAFYNVGATVTDTELFLEQFVTEMPNYPVHPQRHPPGLPLLFVMANQFLANMPDIATQLSNGLRPYQCDNLTLMNTANSSIAAAWIQMLVPFLLGLLLLPLYHWGVTVYDSQTALIAALLWPLIPTIGLWATSWNHLYGIFTILTFLCFYYAFEKRKWIYFLWAGFLISIASFFSFGNVVLIGLLGLYSLSWVLYEGRAGEWRSVQWWGWLICGAVLFFAGTIIVWLFVWWRYDMVLLEIWQTAMGFHFELGRAYVTWLFFHLYDFFSFIGWPVSLLWLFGLSFAIREWWGGDQTKHRLMLAVAAGVLLLDLSGTSQGEVSRVWAFLLPLVLVTAVAYLPRERSWFLLVATLLALQLFVSNIVLRVVNTGLTDPPTAPIAVTPNKLEGVANWLIGPELAESSLPLVATAGDRISVTTIWSTETQLHHPYTIFVHLVDETGKLIAQYDGMPKQGEWPTSCWQPDHFFKDRYVLEIPSDVSEGRYQVNIGFYWLPTGERLLLDDGKTDYHQVGVIGVEAKDK